MRHAVDIPDDLDGVIKTGNLEFPLPLWERSTDEKEAEYRHNQDDDE
jgi:hypothetical protein